MGYRDDYARARKKIFKNEPVWIPSTKVVFMPPNFLVWLGADHQKLCLMAGDSVHSLARYIASQKVGNDVEIRLATREEIDTHRDQLIAASGKIIDELSEPYLTRFSAAMLVISWGGEVLAETVMLCQKSRWNEFPRGEEWVYEEKLDGIRILSAKQGKTVKLVGRSGEEFSARFPEIIEDAGKYPQDFILDGELCSSTGDFRPLAGRAHLKDRLKISIRAGVEPAIYHVFDLLNLDGEYLVGLPLRERKRKLETLGERERVRIVRPRPLEELIGLVGEQKIEGVIAKNLNSTYSLCRSPSWKKFRPAGSFDLPIIGFEESEKPDRPLRSLILLWKGRELQASSGLTGDDLLYARRKFSEAKATRTAKKAGRARHYFEPPVGQAEVCFTSTPDLPVRFPRVIRLKFDRR